MKYGGMLFKSYTQFDLQTLSIISSRNQAIVEWRILDDNRSPIRRYEIHQMRNNEGKIWTVVPHIDNKVEVIYDITSKI